MADATTPLATLKDAVRAFAAERDWEQFHSPKNLVMGLAVEAAELMEHFLWMDVAASRQVVNDPARLVEVADEMADVANYLLNLSNVLGIAGLRNENLGRSQEASRAGVIEKRGRILNFWKRFDCQTGNRSLPYRLLCSFTFGLR